MQGILEFDGQTYEIEVKESGGEISVKVGNRTFTVSLKELEQGFRAAVNSEEEFNIEVTKEQKDLLRLSRPTELSIDGHLYSVLFRPKRLKNDFQASLSANGNGDDASKVKAIMPGNIIKIAVKEGDTVKEGDLLVILEAMKMENEIKSPLSGKVAKINVSENTSVAKGEVLIELEPLEE